MAQIYIHTRTYIRMVLVPLCEHVCNAHAHHLSFVEDDDLFLNVIFDKLASWET